MVGRRRLRAVVALALVAGLLGAARWLWNGAAGAAAGAAAGTTAGTTAGTAASVAASTAASAGRADGGSGQIGVGPGPVEGGFARPRAEPAQANAFFNPTLFYGGLAAAGRAADPSSARLAGGLVPHHDLAAELLSGFFMRLEERPPAVIFLVGPNHDGQGQPVITGRWGWQTDFGLVDTDLPAVESLVDAGLAVVNDGVLAGEHSVGVLMPYIKYHAPDARVVPLVLHHDLTLAQLRHLAEGLAAQLGPDRILIASVDFSHYLTRAEAQARDEETLQAIRKGEIDRLLRMGSDHLDSPGAVAVLLLAMEAIGADGPHVTGHTNSGVILRDDLMETTSYFTFVFEERAD